MQINIPVVVGYGLGLVFSLVCWWLFYMAALWILSMAEAW